MIRKTTIKMNKIFITLTSIVLVGMLNANAQDQPALDQLNAYKVAFFTSKINLTSAEAEKFWPVYNEYQDKKALIQQEKSSLMKSFNQNEKTMSVSQLTELADKIANIVPREAALSMELHKKLITLLPPAKVIRVYQAEGQYKTQLLNELQNPKPNP